MIEQFSNDYICGYIAGKVVGRESVNTLGEAVLDNLLAVFDGYTAKGKQYISIEDAKMETCLCVGRLFRKSNPDVLLDESDVSMVRLPSESRRSPSLSACSWVNEMS